MVCVKTQTGLSFSLSLRLLSLFSLLSYASPALCFLPSLPPRTNLVVCTCLLCVLLTCSEHGWIPSLRITTAGAPRGEAIVQSLLAACSHSIPTLLLSLSLSLSVCLSPLPSPSPPPTSLLFSLSCVSVWCFRPSVRSFIRLSFRQSVDSLVLPSRISSFRWFRSFSSPSISSVRRFAPSPVHNFVIPSVSFVLQSINFVSPSARSFSRPSISSVFPFVRFIRHQFRQSVGSLVHPSTTFVSPLVCSFTRPYISSVRRLYRSIRPSISSIRLFARSSIHHFRESVRLLVHPSINLISFVCSFIRPSVSLVHMFTNSFVHQFSQFVRFLVHSPINFISLSNYSFIHPSISTVCLFYR